MNNAYLYDISYILEDIENRYSIFLSKDEINNYMGEVRAEDELAKTLPHDVIKFADTNGTIYVYGVGLYAEKIANLIGINRIEGFIVSDGYKKEEMFLGKKVYELGEMRENLEIPLVVALSKKNTEQVKESIVEFRNAISLF